MKLEIRSADVSVADARAVRHVLSRVGARVAREPGPIWIINFDDSVGRAAAAAHGIFQEVYRLVRKAPKPATARPLRASVF